MSWRDAMNTVRNFFSEVFKRHTEDDAEQVVIVGAIGTIPDPGTLTSECPRPWLYTRVLMSHAGDGAAVRCEHVDEPRAVL